MSNERSEARAEERAKAKEALRVTDQFRGQRGMVYDLRCAGDRLTVCISPRTSPDDPGEWRVEAHSGKLVDAEIVTGWGATKEAAVRAAGELWPPPGQPRFDWDGVVKLLTAVRAL